jgi:hypothetical protein
MAVPVLIIGKSGSGKSTSMRNCGREFGLINVLGKPLPFKQNPENRINSITLDAIPRIIELMQKYPFKSFVIDDAGYLLTSRYMREYSTARDTYKFFADLGTSFWNLITFAKDYLPPDRIVYFIMHDEKNDNGDIKPKTIGKMLDEKVCVEGMFTIVLRSECVVGDYIFHTRTSGFDVTKTPMGMFDTPTIPNDLKMVDDTIREYYNISTTQGEKTNA